MRLFLAILVGLLFACPSYGDVYVEAGGANQAAAQAITATGNDTVVSGIMGDALHIGSGTVTTTAGARQQVSLSGGTAGGNFTLTTAPYLGASQDGTVRQYATNAFNTEIFFDDDDGPGNNGEIRNGESPINLDGTLHFEFGEFGDNDEISYGYDVLDVTNATRIDDWFEISGLEAGSTFTVSMLTDGATYGFSDASLNIFDSAGTQIAGGDGDTAPDNVFFEVYSATVGFDGIVGIQVTQSGTHPGGTYNLQLDGTAIPEPGSLALLGLTGLGQTFVRRRK